jgi:predicted HTH transcriptional regulator
MTELWNEDYENTVSPKQDLSFDLLNDLYNYHKQPFDNEAWQNLGITNENGKFTIIALVMSDQSPYQTELTVYDGVDKPNRVIRHEVLSGSMLDQTETILNAIFASQFYKNDPINTNGIKNEQVGVHMLLLEVIFNMMLHRNYEDPRDARVSIFDDHIELYNAGGLLPGTTMDEVNHGLVFIRNPKLMEILFPAKLSTSCGTGMKVINGWYKRCIKQPEYIADEDSFTAILPIREPLHL